MRGDGWVGGLVGDAGMGACMGVGWVRGGEFGDGSV